MNKRLGRLLLCGALCLTLCSCATDKAAGYKRAVQTFADGEYEEAAERFERLGDYEQAQTYAAYARGLSYYERGEYVEAEPYFEPVQDFMYGRDRYNYCHAYVLETQGAFAEAAALYAALAEQPYEDAAVHAAYCEGRAAEQAHDYETALYRYEDAGSYADAPALLENLQSQVYARAKELMQEGQYEQALSLFGKLGAYFDSPEQTRVCKDYFRRQLYADAETLLAQGNLQAAYDAFKGLSGYGDSESRAQEIGSQLGYEEEIAE